VAEDDDDDEGDDDDDEEDAVPSKKSAAVNRNKFAVLLRKNAVSLMARFRARAELAALVTEEEEDDDDDDGTIFRFGLTLEAGELEEGIFFLVQPFWGVGDEELKKALLLNLLLVCSLLFLLIGEAVVAEKEENGWISNVTSSFS